MIYFKVWKNKCYNWLPGNSFLSCPLPTCCFTLLNLTVPNCFFTVCEILSRVQLHLLLFALSAIPKVLNDLFKTENSLTLHVFLYLEMYLYIRCFLINLTCLVHLCTRDCVVKYHLSLFLFLSADLKSLLLKYLWSQPKILVVLQSQPLRQKWQLVQFLCL